MKLTAVVVNHCTLNRTRAAVASLGEVPAIVVDNGSGPHQAELLRQALPRAVHLVLPDNRGFAAGANLGIEQALASGATRVFLLNSDARVRSDTLARLCRAMDADRRIGLAGPIVLDGAGRVQSAGLGFSPLTGRLRLYRALSERVDALSGCALLIDARVVRALGAFDEPYFFGMEDVDLCLRARGAGFRLACVEEAFVDHDGGGTLPADSPARIYFAARNHLRLVARLPASPMQRATRELCVAASCFAFALVRSDAARVPAVRAFARGVRDHLRGRYGPG
jgi:GT2 family glycosyltransferase